MENYPKCNGWLQGGLNNVYLMTFKLKLKLSLKITKNTQKSELLISPSSLGSQAQKSAKITKKSSRGIAIYSILIGMTNIGWFHVNPHV